MTERRRLPKFDSVSIGNVSFEANAACSAEIVRDAGGLSQPALRWPVTLTKQLTEDQLCVPSDAGRAILAHGKAKGTICALPAAPGVRLQIQLLSSTLHCRPDRLFTLIFKADAAGFMEQCMYALVC